MIHVNEILFKPISYGFPYILADPLNDGKRVIYHTFFLEVSFTVRHSDPQQLVRSLSFDVISLMFTGEFRHVYEISIILTYMCNAQA